MKKLNKAAEAIFRTLIGGLESGESCKYDNGGACIMAVHVEQIRTVDLGPIYSIAHYYEQNGDLVCDPDMTFLVASTDNSIYPITFEQGGMLYQEAVEWDGDRIKGVRPKTQRDITNFANTWMRNIKEQQRL